MFDIQEETKKLPQKPGVYIMKNEADAVIYVGKAKNLRNRVRQYFQASGGDSPKIQGIRAEISTFEFIVTDTELEALILENTLIKKYWPKFNTLLKDDKSYPYVKITTNEMFPRVFKAHRMEKDKARYFGPYTSGTAILDTLALVAKIWPLRRCAKQFPRDLHKGRPCLYYHMGQCLGPCDGKISEKDYNLVVDEIIQFFNGKHDEILKQLEADMLASAEALQFEKAAELRDKRNAVLKLSERQKLDSGYGDDMDIIAFARAHNEAMVQVFFLRSGKMTGREQYMLEGVQDQTREEVITDFVKQFYGETTFIPKELVLQTALTEPDIVLEWLSGLKGRRVNATVPQRGEKKRLVDLAAKNAVIALEQRGDTIKREKEKTVGALEELRQAMGLDFSLERIEAYDISNTQGFESVGSMVVFEGGKPKRSDYRKFKIKGISGPDDYASMEEVITRRFLRYQKETEQLAQGARLDARFNKLPDILFIDGGKGQVSAAQDALRAVAITVPVCGMIKDDRHRTRGLVYEGQEITFSTHSEGFKLITRIQDEVHRFAIEYHRTLRSNAQIHSVLNDIEGIGPTRRKALLRHFGSIDAIRAAEPEALASVPGMNKKTAEAVYLFFRS